MFSVWPSLTSSLLTAELRAGCLEGQKEIFRLKMDIDLQAFCFVKSKLSETAIETTDFSCQVRPGELVVILGKARRCHRKSVQIFGPISDPNGPGRQWKIHVAARHLGRDLPHSRYFCSAWEVGRPRNY